MAGNKAIITQIGGYAIGDTIYANISMRYLSKHYEKLYTYHPIPCLLSNIPNLTYIDSASFHNTVFRQQETEDSLWCRHLHQSVKPLIQPLDISYDDSIDVFTSLQMGEGLREGHYYPEELISGPAVVWIQECKEKHRLFTPDPASWEREQVKQWMIRAGIDFSKPVILFHPVWTKDFSHQLPARAGRTHEARQVFSAVSRFTKNLVDVEVLSHELFTAFPSIKTLHTFGEHGLRITKAVMQLCDGVFMQQTCRLLPYAQSVDKPTLVMSRGGHALSSLNWPRFDHPPFLEIEPNDIHFCRAPCAFCEVCDRNPIPKQTIARQVEAFIHQVQCEFQTRKNNI